MTLGVGVAQFCVFLLFWACSVVVSTAYLFGEKLCKTMVATVIFDVIFSVGAILFFIYLNIQTNNGECRLFLFLAIALGIVTSYFCFARPLDKLSNKVYNLFTTGKVDKNGSNIL